jgi:hypothetical protein
MATLVAGPACVEDVKEKEIDNTCTVCMECVPEKYHCVRPCGHMMCASCDAAWQSRGKIEEFKMQHKDKKGDTMMVYMTVSNCPSCRRKDAPHDYRNRSKLSMMHEIQFLTRTLYLSGIRVPISYESKFNEMDETSVITTPPLPLIRRMDVFTPYVPPVVRVPVMPPAMTLPPVPPASHATGICCRRVQRVGECYTTRTKLRCSACTRFLCRSCRGGGCVCQSL